MGKRRSITVGFSYYMGLHMGISRGPLNSIAQIKIGGRTAYYNPGDLNLGTENIWPPQIAVTPPSGIADQVININAPDLFGGTKSEGGIVGSLRLLPGSANQVAPIELKNMLGNPDSQPDFRGVQTAYFDGMICQMNPYPKPWRFLCRRTTAGWDGAPWYPERCTIYHTKPFDPDNPFDPNTFRRIHAMNGAHILYECLTNTQWGRGLHPSRIDGAAFRQAADTLWDEQMGLCLRWSRSDLLESFVQTVLDHIAAVLYLDKATGLYTVKLLRDDYDFDSLPLLTTDNGILEITEASSGSTSEAINEVIVNYYDPIADIEAQVRAQNLAAIQTMGSAASRVVDYPGCPTDALALKLAQRDLKVGSTNLRRFKIVADRRLWWVQPGAVIKVRDTSRGIGQIALRVGTVEDGTLTDGKITIVAVQDVFAFSISPFAAVQEPLGQTPDFRPQARRHVAYEKPYVELNQEYPRAEFNALPAAACLFNQHLEKATPLCVNYNITVQLLSDPNYFNTGTTGEFSPVCELASTLDYFDEQFTYTDDTNLELIEPDSAVLINNLEWARFVSIDRANKTCRIKRGTMDTRPHRHLPGVEIWFTTTTGGSNYVEYAPGQSLVIRGIPFTFRGGALNTDLAPTDNVTMNWRFNRPYLPGNVNVQTLSSFIRPWFQEVQMFHDTGGVWVNGSYVSSPDYMTVTWAHRDRVLQADQLIEHQVGNIGPEPGVTYRAKILRTNGEVIRTIDGVMGAQLIYTYGMAAADYDVENGEDQFAQGVMRLCAVRSGLESWQDYVIFFRVYKEEMSLPPPPPPGEGGGGGGDGEPIIVSPQVNVATIYQTTATNISDDDAESGVLMARMSQMVAMDEPEDDISGIYVSRMYQSSAADEIYVDSFASFSMESPYITLVREGRNLFSSNLRILASAPEDKIIEYYNIKDRVNNAPYGETEPEYQTHTGDNSFSPWAKVTGVSVLGDTLTVRLPLVRERAGTDNMGRPIYAWVPDPTRPWTSEKFGGFVPLNFVPGMLAKLGDEIVEITAINRNQYGPFTINIKRGCADTIPRAHGATDLWFMEQNPGVSPRPWPGTSTAQYGLIPVTEGLPVDPNSVTTYMHRMMDRTIRPYAPGLVIVNGQHWFDGGKGVRADRGVEVTWAHRNRIWQGGDSYDHFDVGIPLEPGVEYVFLGNYGKDKAKTQARIITTNNSVYLPYEEAVRWAEGYYSFVFDQLYANWLGRDMEKERFRPAPIYRFPGYGPFPVTLYAIRDGLASWQSYEFTAYVADERIDPPETPPSVPGVPPLPGTPVDPGTPGNGGGAGGPGDPIEPTNPGGDPGTLPPPPPEDPDDDGVPPPPDTTQPPITPPEPPAPDPEDHTGWGNDWSGAWDGRIPPEPEND